jgi:single-stranded-DNA-specific exonuclease
VTIESIYAIGEGKHTKFTVSRWGYEYECVLFNSTVDDVALIRGDRADIAFTPQINEFRGRRSVQLLITDIRPAQERGLREKLGSFFDGGDIAPEDAYSLLPERRDFVSLWKRLKSGGQPHSAAEKEYICLKVFQELGLISLTETDDITEIQVSDQGKKVDLDSSLILKRLSEAV